MAKFNEKITLRSLLLISYDNESAQKRFKFASRDIIITKLKVKKVTTYSRRKSPTRTIEVQSFSHPNYTPYLKKGKTKGTSQTKQRTITHDYPVSISFYTKGSEEITLDTPVKLRTGKGGSYPKKPKNFDTKMKASAEQVSKAIKGKLKNNNIYVSFSDYVARRYHINGDFYWRQAYNRADEHCLFGRYYPPSKEKSPVKSKKTSKSKNAVNTQSKKKKSKEKPLPKIFLTKHEIAVIDVLFRKGILKDSGYEEHFTIRGNR